MVLRDVVAQYGKAEAGLRRRLELAEAREAEARLAKRRRKGEEKRTADGVAGQEKGVVGTEGGGNSSGVVCLDDDGWSDEGAGLRSVSPDASEDEACSSGEEYNPQERGKNCPRGRRAAAGGEAKAGAVGGPGATSSSFVACPICGKNVRHMYMNSHIDACLMGGGGSAGSRSGAGRGRAASLSALEVPPKLVLLGALNNASNEKKLKNELRKYNISTEGCASARELLDRYMRFRTAVEVSNDKGEEGASYEKIVFRMMKEERSKKMAGMFGGRRASRVKSTVGGANPGGEPGVAGCHRVSGQDGYPSPTAASVAPNAFNALNTSNASRASRNKVVIDMTEDVAGVGVVTEAPRRFDPSRINLSEIRHPREILLPEDATFEEMVAVTLLRDRVRIMLLEEFHDDQT